MPRLRRLDYAGAHHHVMSRGARKAPIFHDDQDCAAFLDLLAELPSRHGLLVHGFALMPNHFHLLVETRRDNLSEAMRHLCGQHARRFNTRHHIDGPVFRGRFKSVLVERDDAWAYLLTYLHLNPVRAHLVPSADAARWTSHPYYSGERPAPEWLATEELREILGSPEAYRTYLHEVQIGRESAPEGVDPEELWRSAAHQPRPASSAEPGAATTLDVALGQVVAVTGVPVAELARHRRGGKGNRAAWLAAWWLTRETAEPQAVIGKLLGCSQTGVSQRIRHLREHAADDPRLREAMDRLQDLGSAERPGAPWRQNA